jgi:hypothetical protein
MPRMKYFKAIITFISGIASRFLVILFSTHLMILKTIRVLQDIGDRLKLSSVTNGMTNFGK